MIHERDSVNPNAEEEISQEQARQDVENFLAHFSTTGSSSQEELGAFMFLNSLRILRKRIGDNPSFLKMIYLGEKQEENPLIPSLATQTVQRVVDGNLTPGQAGIFLDKLIPQYEEAFGQLGFSPQRPQGFLFFKD